MNRRILNMLLATTAGSLLLQRRRPRTSQSYKGRRSSLHATIWPL
jgi:hypothetical protein